MRTSPTRAPKAARTRKRWIACCWILPGWCYGIAGSPVRIVVGAQIDLGLRPLAALLRELGDRLLAADALALPEQRAGRVDGEFDLLRFLDVSRRGRLRQV